MRTFTKRRLLAAAVAVAVAATIGACSQRPPSNEIVLYYTGGTGEDKEFERCIQPGTNGDAPYDDTSYAIRTDTRTWNIAPQGGDSSTPIESGTAFNADGQPGPSVKTWASADFVINRDCKAPTGDADSKDSPLVRFWETLGRRYGIATLTDGGENGWNDAGWQRLLQNTLVVAEQKALAEGTRLYSADELVSNGKGQRAELEKRIATSFQSELRAKLGGDFLCGVTYQTDAHGRAVKVEYDEYESAGKDANGVEQFKLKSPKPKSTCPPIRISITDIDYANADIGKAREDVYAATLRAKEKLIAAQAELDASRLLGQAAQNEAYLRYQAIQAQVKAAEACKANSNCTVIIDGTGNAGVLTGK